MVKGTGKDQKWKKSNSIWFLKGVLKVEWVKKNNVGGCQGESGRGKWVRRGVMGAWTRVMS